MSYFNHPKNLGLGQAMDTLLHYAAQNYNDQDILITFDADNTHNPSIIPHMIKKLSEENLDIVIASRFTGESRELGLSIIRKLYSRGATLFCQAVFHIRNVHVYSCGYRAYRVGFIKKLLADYGGEVIKSRGFECMVEILAKAGKIGVRADEVPFVLEYNLKEGKSKMNAKKTILGYMRLAFQVRRPKAKMGA
jgi:dolichol-phosphate mannosyltransferase